jgi:hypothetical protein
LIKDTDSSTDVDPVPSAFTFASLFSALSLLFDIHTIVFAFINTSTSPSQDVRSIAKMARYTRKQIVTFISIIYLVFVTAIAG